MKNKTQKKKRKKKEKETIVKMWLLYILNGWF